MKRIIFFITLLYVSMSVSAQTVSTAKQINNIKKDKKYIYAEYTDSTEQAAYSAAKSILDGKIDNYIQDKGLADGANTIIVKDIRKTVNKLSLPRGTKHYVFLYVKQTDIIKSETEVEAISISNSSQQTSVVPSDDIANVDEVSATPPAVSAVEPTVASPVVAEAPIKAQPEQVVITGDYMSKLPKYRQNTIKKLLEVKDLSQAQTTLNEEILILHVLDYGVKKDCPNSNKVYWVVNGKEGITVLSPATNGNRVNVKTGQTDTLYNYKEGLWFRFK